MHILHIIKLFLPIKRWYLPHGLLLLLMLVELLLILVQFGHVLAYLLYKGCVVVLDELLLD